MNHIFENIKNVEALADICQKDIRQYQAMRTGSAEQWEVDAFIPKMDDNNYAFTEAVRKLNLDNQDEMIKFIRAVKALGAVEALERVQDTEEFSNWVNLGLQSWVNRIKAESAE